MKELLEAGDIEEGMKITGVKTANGIAPIFFEVKAITDVSEKDQLIRLSNGNSQFWAPFDCVYEIERPVVRTRDDNEDMFMNGEA